MELNITEFFRSVSPCELSGSRAELGDNAGSITWNASIESASTEPPAILDTEEKRQAFREFVGDSGGWNDEEIAAWSDTELEALCRQWIAGDMREPVGFELGADSTPEQWADYRAQCEAGNCAGRLFTGTDGNVYFDIGS